MTPHRIHYPKIVLIALCTIACLLLLSSGSVFTAHAAGTETIKPSDNGGWTLAVETGTGTGEYVTGPGTPPMGTGSVQFSLDSGASGLIVGLADYQGVRLDEITTLTYSTYQTGGTVQAAALQFNVDYDVTDIGPNALDWQGRLVFEPYHSEAVSTGTWQTWNTLTEGRWWATGSPGNGTCTQVSPCTWAEVLTAFPDAGIHSTLGAVLFKAGSGWPGGFVGNVDAFTIGVNGDDTTYDFEPETQCTTVCYVDSVNGDDSFGGDTPASAKATIQAAIAQLTPGGTIYVAAGSYPEIGQIVIDKDMTIIGDGIGSTIVTPTGNTTTSGDGRGWWLVEDGVTLHLSEMTLDGTGYLIWQGIRHLGAGTIDNVEFTQIRYQASGSPYGGVAVAAFGDDGPVDISNSSFSEIGRVGVLYFGAGVSGSSFTDNTYVGKGAGDWLDYALDISNGAVITVTGNSISNNQGVASSDGSTSAGILVTTFFGPGTEALITENDIFDNTTGIFVGFDGTDTSLVEAHNNNITGNLSAGVRSTNPTVDATLNWWNDATGPSGEGPGTGDAVSEDVLFCPWLTDSYPGGVAGPVTNIDTSEVFCTIQDAIDDADTLAGHTIEVIGGTYVEQVNDHKGVTLVGVDGAASTFIVAPSTIPASSSNDSVIVRFTSGGSSEISGFTITGPGPSGCGSILAGIFVRDGSTVYIHDNQILAIRDEPFSGCQNGVGILVGRSTIPTTGHATIENNLIEDFQKNGITVSGAGSTADVIGNTINGAGASGTIAQNGVQFSTGTSGTIDDNDIDGMYWTGAIWASTGILSYGDVTADNNTLTNTQVGIYQIGGTASYTNNDITQTFYGGIGMWGAIGYGGDTDFIGNTVIGDDTAGTAGIGVYDDGGAPDVFVVIENTITDWDYGVDVGDYNASFGSVNVNNNNITSNVSYGIFSNLFLTDGTLNWWGDASGPSGEGPGTGDAVSENVLYCPWLLGPYPGGATVAHVTNLDTAEVFCTIQEAIDDSDTLDGHTLQLSTGTFSGPGNENVDVDKSVTIVGDDPSTTFVDPTTVGFFINADDVTLADFTIHNGSQGVRFEMAGGTIDNTEFNNMHFVDNSSRGIEIHNATTVTNMSVIDSYFENNGVGIRLASSAVGNGIEILGTTFDTHSLAFYQANEGSTGYVHNLHIDDSEFYNSTDTAVFAEEIYDSTIENSTFTDNRRGITIFKNYTTAGVNVSNLTISGNEFNNQLNSSILYFQANSGLTGPVDITGNTINQDVGVLAANWATIDIRLEAGFSHGAINVTGNDITLSGTYDVADAAYGIQMRGGSDNITVSGNTLEGNSIGDGGGTPPTSGIFIRTNDGTMGATSASAVINITNNDILNFVNGVSIYDTVGAAYGGLPIGADVNINYNNITGNGVFGLQTATSEITDATCNWWGDYEGPSGEGPGAGDAVSIGATFDPWLLSPAPDGICAEVGTVQVELFNADDILTDPHVVHVSGIGTFTSGDEFVVPAGTYNYRLRTNNVNGPWLQATFPDDLENGALWRLEFATVEVHLFNAGDTLYDPHFVHISGIGTYSSGDVFHAPPDTTLSYRLRTNNVNGPWQQTDFDAGDFVWDLEFATVEVHLFNAGDTLYDPHFVHISGIGTYSSGDVFHAPPDTTLSYRLRTNNVNGPWQQTDFDAGDFVWDLEFATVEVHLFNAGDTLYDPHFVHVSGIGTYSSGDVFHAPPDTTLSYRLRTNNVNGPWQQTDFDAGDFVWDLEFATIEVELYNADDILGDPHYVHVSGIGTYTSGDVFHAPPDTMLDYRLRTNNINGPWQERDFDAGDYLWRLEFATVTVQICDETESVHVSGIGTFVNGDTFHAPPDTTLDYRVKINNVWGAWIEVSFPAGDTIWYFNCPSTITIVKDTQPNNGRNFTFEGTDPIGDFTLDDDGGNNATYTNSETFPDLDAGEYTITETGNFGEAWGLADIVCEGAVNTTFDIDLDTNSVTIDLAPDENVTCTFINQRTPRIRVRKYEDLNENGNRNGGQGEDWLEGWTITLYDEGGQQVDQIVTDSNGRANFTNLEPGTYTVCETQQQHWVNTQPGTIDATYNEPCYEVTVGLGDVENLRFGNHHQTGSLTVTKEVDWFNADPIPGVEFEVCVSGGNLEAPACEDLEHGESFTVPGLEPGDYTITEPSLGAEWTMTLSDTPTVVEDVETEITVTNTHDDICEGLSPDPDADLRNGGTHLNWPYDNGDVYNTSRCFSYEVGIAAYLVIDGSVETQILHDAESMTVLPGQTVNLSVSLPDCTVQVDLFYGYVITDLSLERYTGRLLDFQWIQGNGWCDDPFAEDPPQNDPPDNDPPQNDPPVNDPPQNDPPVNDPPQNDPPVNDPPQEEPPVCTPNPDGDLKHGGSHLNPPFDNGTVTNLSDACTYEIGIASYMVMDGSVTTQQLLGSQTMSIGPGQTVNLGPVPLAGCTTQVDLFYGYVITDFSGGERYGNRLIDVRWVGSEYCGEPEPPQQQQAPAQNPPQNDPPQDDPPAEDPPTENPTGEQSGNSEPVIESTAEPESD